jgi:hypothetical protein
MRFLHLEPPFPVVSHRISRMSGEFRGSDNY